MKELLPTLERGAFAQIGAASPMFEQWTFDDVFDAGLHSLIAGIEHDGARRRPPAPATAP